MNSRRYAVTSMILGLAVALSAGCNKSSQSAQAPTPAAQQQPAYANGAPGAAGDPSAANNAAQPPAPNGSAIGGAPQNRGSYPAQGAQQSQPGSAAAAATSQPIVVPAGTTLSVRMGQTINVKHATDGEAFSGTLAQPIVVGGSTVFPAGSPVNGRVDYAKKRGRFKGASLLELRLTGIDANGQHYRIDTHDVARSKKGKGKRSLAMIGGGSGLGMLIGGIATGGTGLLIGGLAGAGAGTAGAAFTGNGDITIPAESVLSFRLAQSVDVSQ